MEKHKIKQYAADFLATNNISTEINHIIDSGANDIRFTELLANTCTQFLQSMIEKGEVVTKQSMRDCETALQIAVNSRDFNRKRVLELEKNKQSPFNIGSQKAGRHIVNLPEELTLSSAGKEVNNLQLGSIARKLIGDINVNDSNAKYIAQTGKINGSLLMDLLDAFTKYHEHFKSSPASTEQPNQQAGEVKSLQECKDEVGRKYFYKDWDDCISGFNSPEGLSIIGKRYDEACGIYCRQFKNTATPVKEIITDGDHICQKCGSDNPAWYAENELFNEVNGSPNGVVCPSCFIKMAEAKGINIMFKAVNPNEATPVKEISDESLKLMAYHTKSELVIRNEDVPIFVDGFIKGYQSQLKAKP